MVTILTRLIRPRAAKALHNTHRGTKNRRRSAQVSYPSPIAHCPGPKPQGKRRATASKVRIALEVDSGRFEYVPACPTTVGAGVQDYADIAVVEVGTSFFGRARRFAIHGRDLGLQVGYVLDHAELVETERRSVVDPDVRRIACLHGCADLLFVCARACETGCEGYVKLRGYSPSAKFSMWARMKSLYSGWKSCLCSTHSESDEVERALSPPSAAARLPARVQPVRHRLPAQPNRWLHRKPARNFDVSAYFWPWGILLGVVMVLNE